MTLSSNVFLVFEYILCCNVKLNLIKHCELSEKFILIKNKGTSLPRWLLIYSVVDNKVFRFCRPSTFTYFRRYAQKLAILASIAWCCCYLILGKCQQLAYLSYFSSSQMFIMRQFIITLKHCSVWSWLSEWSLEDCIHGSVLMSLVS